MSKARTEVLQLENMVVTGKKKFVRYAEGARLYSLGLHTFQEIAKEANKRKGEFKNGSKCRNNILSKRKIMAWIRKGGNGGTNIQRSIKISRT